MSLSVQRIEVLGMSTLEESQRPGIRSRPYAFMPYEPKSFSYLAHQQAATRRQTSETGWSLDSLPLHRGCSGNVPIHLQVEADRVANRFGKRSSWCRHDLAERARRTDYLESYRVLNPIASSFVHVTPYGLHRRFDGEDRWRIDVPPSTSWVEQSLVSGHSLTLGMVLTLIRCFHPDQEQTLFARLEADYRNAWHRPAEPA